MNRVGIRFWFLCALWGLMILAGPVSEAASAQTEPAAGDALKLVAIDPGHGGEDRGLTGPGGWTEDQMTLVLARELQTALEKELGLTVYLTHDEKTGPSTAERAGLANGLKAQAFLSIHAGDDTCPRGGFRIYFQEYRLQSGLSHYSSPDSLDLGPTDEWLLLQAPHVPDSYRLAVELDEALMDVLRVKGPGPEGLPLAVLAGADQAAVVLEIGNLTDAESERRLRTQGFRDAVTRAVVQAFKSWRAWLEER